MRAPFALDCRPAPSSMMPALTISSLNLAIALSISSDGILLASESLVALTITMKRIVPLLRYRCDGRSTRRIVGVNSADFFGGSRLLTRHGGEALPNAGIGDPYRGAAAARLAAIGRRVQYGEHRQGDRRQDEIPRLEFDHGRLRSLVSLHKQDEPEERKSTGAT